MKKLLSLFLLLIPCLTWAQYPSNGNQKITLGEQTTADGLIYRGVASTDTVRKPSVDTMAYMVLDTTTNIMWHYKKATSNAWLRLNLLPSDTASMLTNYYRSGRTGIIQASDVPTLNQNTTGSAATLTTSRTFQTNLASTSTASFNGSANVTPGVTGTLGGANGGTGIATFGAAGNIPFASSTTLLNVNSKFNLDNVSFGFPVFKVDGVIRMLNAGQFQFFNLNNDYAFSFSVASNSRVWLLQNNAGSDVFIARGPERSLGIRYNFADSAQVTEALSVNGNARITAVGAGTFSNNLNITSDGTLTTATSDEKFKYNIRPLNYGLETLLQLKPVNFQWIEGEEEDLGFIAQDVAEIIPEAVNTNWNSDLLFRYESLIPILTKAIQEQQAQIEALKQRIINLENK